MEPSVRLAAMMGARTRSRLVEYVQGTVLSTSSDAATRGVRTKPRDMVCATGIWPSTRRWLKTSKIITQIRQEISVRDDIEGGMHKPHKKYRVRVDLC